MPRRRIRYIVPRWTNSTSRMSQRRRRKSGVTVFVLPVRELTLGAGAYAARSLILSSARYPRGSAPIRRLVPEGGEDVFARDAVLFGHLLDRPPPDRVATAPPSSTQMRSAAVVFGSA